jgi:ParB family transcriptional regulator, chromosome partitioning protein
MVVPLQKGRLGRGLASLIGESPQAETRLPVHGEQRLLPIADLHPSGRNPRKSFDEGELAELANSIRAKGLVQPIIARPDPQRGGYEIVAGERRWRAAQRAGLHTVAVIVRDLSDLEVAEFALIENVQRSDLNAIEEAAGYQELIEKFGYTQEQLAEAIGKSRSHLANMLRLLKLPARVQALVKEGKLSPGAARAIVGHANVDVLAEEIVARGLTVREVEALVSDMQQEPGGAVSRGGGSGSTQAREPRDKDADTRAFEKDLSDSLGLSVEVQRGSGESGLLSIRYSNYEQLDYIRARLIGPPAY